MAVKQLCCFADVRLAPVLLERAGSLLTPAGRVVAPAFEREGDAHSQNVERVLPRRLEHSLVRCFLHPSQGKQSVEMYR